MKKIIKSWAGIAIAAAAALALSAPASAVTWTDNIGYVDTWGTAPAGGWNPVLVTSPNTYSFTHSILDSGFTSGGFQITDVDLEIWLADDDAGFLGFGGDSSEKVSFRFDSNTNTWTTPAEVDGSTLCFFGCNWDSFSLSPGNSLLTDGQLKVDLKATEGDFYFKRSLLTVTGRAVSVPEPATLALFGMGLVGVGFASRRRRQAA